VQQLREAFAESCPYRYAILDRDAKFGADVIDLLKASGMKPKLTSPSSPWQSGVAERWIGSCRRELLDHVIVLSDRRRQKRECTDEIIMRNADRGSYEVSLDERIPCLRISAWKFGLWISTF
jgi:transposase InsO family protein